MVWRPPDLALPHIRPWSSPLPECWPKSTNLASQLFRIEEQYFRRVLAPFCTGCTGIGNFGKIFEIFVNENTKRATFCLSKTFSSGLVQKTELGCFFFLEYRSFWLEQKWQTLLTRVKSIIRITSMILNCSFQFRLVQWPRQWQIFLNSVDYDQKHHSENWFFNSKPRY